MPSFVVLRRFRDLPDALIARSILDSAGLESFFLDEITIRMDWFWSDLLGGIKICVASEDAEDGDQLLKPEIPERFFVEGIGEFEQPRCLKCKSLQIAYEDWNKLIAFIAILLVSFPIPVRRRRWRCRSCGHTWKEPYDSKPAEK